MTPPDSRAATPTGPARWVRLLALGGPMGLVAALGVVYALGGFGKAGPAVCPATASMASRLDPLVHGEVAALSLTHNGRLAPDLAFKTADGASTTLASFKGRTVLLNLWATWCIPCRKEMPALDRLQAKLGGDDFQVVAVNIDTAKLDRPKQFLQDAGVTHLPLYTDSTANVFQVLRTQGKAMGLPTTMLIGRDGCEIGSMAGPAEWDSGEAQSLIEAAKESGSPKG